MQKLCSNEPHFYIMFPATGIVDIVQNFLLGMILQQVEVAEEKWVVEVVEMEAEEVAFLVEEVVVTIMVVVEPRAMETFGRSAAMELPVFVPVESQKLEEKEP